MNYLRSIDGKVEEIRNYLDEHSHYNYLTRNLFEKAFEYTRKVESVVFTFDDIGDSYQTSVILKVLKECGIEMLSLTQAYPDIESLLRLHEDGWRITHCDDARDFPIDYDDDGDPITEDISFLCYEHVT